jgi:glycosyltransferase involved in cell wall biosynthesis
MKILVDCRCLNYPFFTGVNSYAVRLLDTLRIIKSKRPDMEVVSLGLKPSRLIQLQKEFALFEKLFDRNTSLVEYSGYDLDFGDIEFGHKFMETKLIVKNWFGLTLDKSYIEQFEYVILPQPRLLPLHPDSKLITVFHDIYSILNRNISLPQSLIFNHKTCQTLVDRSYKVIAGSISTCQDVNMTFLNAIGFRNPKLQLIYPSIPKIDELQKTRTEDRLAGDKIQSEYVLAVSGIEPRKNWENLILAHHHLQQNQDWKVILVLAGSIVDNKYYQKLIKLIQTLDIQNIVWKLNPSESQKFSLIQNSLFLCYPSMYEGFGFPILEAFDHGKTVVTSRISSMPEIGKNSCVYVNPFSYVSIANGIWLMFSDKDFHKALETSIESNKSQYNWSEMESALEKLLV